MCKENKEGNILKGFMGSVVATIRVDKKGVTRSFIKAKNEALVHCRLNMLLVMHGEVFFQVVLLIYCKGETAHWKVYN